MLVTFRRYALAAAPATMLRQRFRCLMLSTIRLPLLSARCFVCAANVTRGFDGAADDHDYAMAIFTPLPYTRMPRYQHFNIIRALLFLLLYYAAA